MRRILISLLCMVSLSASAQHTVVVNPDGTHSIAINHGKTSTIVNHSTAINHGRTSTIINSDGTHSVAINHGNTSTIVNPDGTHSVVIKKGKRATKDKPKWEKWRAPKSKDKKE